MKNLRIAVVGCGFWSRFQVPAWQELSDVDCVAVCDLDQVKARQTAGAFGIGQSYSDAADRLPERSARRNRAKDLKLASRSSAT